MRQFTYFTPALLLFLFIKSIYPMGFNLGIESEAGFQTGIPNDSLLSSYPFCQLYLEPSWSEKFRNRTQFMIAAPMNVLKYIGGLEEVAVGQEVMIEKPFKHTSTQLEVSATFNHMPVAFDQTIPENFFEFSLEYSQQSIEKVPLGGTYCLSVLRDIETSRIDFKNTLKCKWSKMISSKLYIFIKIGCSWNISNFEGAGYIQPVVTGGTSVSINDKNFLLVQLYGAYSFYETMKMPVPVRAGKNGNGKVIDTLMYDLSIPGTPFASLYCDYDRELSPAIHFHFIYMPVLFGSGKPYSLHLSHRLSIMFEWRRK
jgi:hypothetical protein